MFHDPINKTVISIGAFMVTLQPLESRILRHAQRQTVFRSQFFQFRKDAICNDRDAFGVKAVHHCRDHFEFVLDRVRQEVGIDQDGVRRRKGSIVLKEQCGGNLRAVDRP